MRFSAKIVFGTCMILAICFSAGGIYMIQQNFQVAYDTAVENSTRQHILDRYSLESNLRNALENGREYNEELVTEIAARMDNYADTNRKMLVYEPLHKNTHLQNESNANKEIWYTDIPRLDATMIDYMKDSNDEFVIYEQGEFHYLLIATTITIAGHSVRLLNQYDISATYLERERQLKEFIWLDSMILVLSLLLVLLFSLLLTRNIKKLSRVSSRIAKGEYSQCTKIASRDEIGELSRNFDVMAEAVECQIAKLNQEIEAREQFVSDFSHELKTPMTAMMGYSKLLLGKEPDEGIRQKAVDYIYRECKRLKTLSGALLQMLGMTEDEIVCKKLYTSFIGQRVYEVCEAGLCHAVLSVELADAMIVTDAELILTLLRNLIENADHACVNRENGRIRLLGEEQNNGYMFTICDNGCGIPKEELKQITRAFYMVDKSRSRQEGGSGLGLAICDRICEVLGITMSIESEEEEGTRVMLLLPKSEQKGEDV